MLKCPVTYPAGFFSPSDPEATSCNKTSRSAADWTLLSEALFRLDVPSTSIVYVFTQYNIRPVHGRPGGTLSDAQRCTGVEPGSTRARCSVMTPRRLQQEEEIFKITITWKRNSNRPPSPVPPELFDSSLRSQWDPDRRARIKVLAVWPEKLFQIQIQNSKFFFLCLKKRHNLL